MAMNPKSLSTLNENSTFIAGVSRNQTDELYRVSINLYRHNNGKWYTREFGGAAMAIDNQPKWIDRNLAVEFVSTLATDPVTGYGYTKEQAEIMVDGGDAGRGYRGRD